MDGSYIQNVTKTNKADKRPTIRDVAQMAGVSLATVSAAFNRGPVRVQTRERILRAGRKLGYRPNLIARSMVTKKTRVLGLLMPWNNVEMTDAATAAASRLGYDLIVLFSGNEVHKSERHCIERLIERMTDGIIWVPAQKQDEDYGEMISIIRSARAEVVAADRYFQEMKVDAVVTDNRRGAAEAVGHLLSLGHKRILMLAGEAECSSTRDRIAGYRDALGRAGIVLDEDLIVRAEQGCDETRKLLGDIVSNGKGVTAVFAAEDHLAFDMLLSCRDRGVRIPQDISLVGFDDVLLGTHRICELLLPALTTVRQDFTDMLNKATELLVSRIEGAEQGQTRTTYVESRLIVRESTAALPQA